MHYYKFNVGNYYRHTHNLTLMEDLAYRRMLDKYYLNESPLPNDVKKIARLIGMREQEEEIKLILEDFFTLTECGLSWVNDTADKVITKYQSDANTAKENGKKGGRPRKETQNKPSGLAKETQLKPDGNPEITGSQANNKQLTTNKEQLTSNNIKNIEPAAHVKWNKKHFADELIKLGANVTHVNDWMTTRKTFSETAFKGTINHINKTDKTVAQIVELCAEKGWKGFDSKYLEGIQQTKGAGLLNFNRGVDQSGFGDDSNIIDGFVVSNQQGFLEHD